MFLRFVIARAVVVYGMTIMTKVFEIVHPVLRDISLKLCKSGRFKQTDIQELVDHHAMLIIILQVLHLFPFHVADYVADIKRCSICPALVESVLCH